MLHGRWRRLRIADSGSFWPNCSFRAASGAPSANSLFAGLRKDPSSLARKPRRTSGSSSPESTMATPPERSRVFAAPADQLCCLKPLRRHCQRCVKPNHWHIQRNRIPGVLRDGPATVQGKMPVSPRVRKKTAKETFETTDSASRVCLAAKRPPEAS